jgi:hypothetical protein
LSEEKNKKRLVSGKVLLRILLLTISNHDLKRRKYDKFTLLKIGIKVPKNSGAYTFKAIKKF